MTTDLDQCNRKWTLNMSICLDIETSSSTLIKHYQVWWIPTSFIQVSFTSCKAEQPLQVMEFQEKEKDKMDMGKLFIENPKKKGTH